MSKLSIAEQAQARLKFIKRCDDMKKILYNTAVYVWDKVKCMECFTNINTLHHDYFYHRELSSVGTRSDFCAPCFEYFKDIMGLQLYTKWTSRICPYGGLVTVISRSDAEKRFDYWYLPKNGTNNSDGIDFYNDSEW
jgi:hypothetical protein